MTTIAKFVTDLNTVANKAGALGATLQEMIKSAKDQKAFKAELYAAAKGKGDACYAACRQLYSRALKALGITTTEKRGAKVAATKAAKAAAAPKGEAKAAAAPKGEAKATGVTDALALARVGVLATTFLVEEDKVIMARLLAAIDHKLKGATKAKK